MAFNRNERTLSAKKSRPPIFKKGVPDNKEGSNGDVAYIDLDGIGTVQYVKKDNAWTPIVSGVVPSDTIVSNSIVNWMKKNQSFTLQIIASQTPRQYNIPWYTRAFRTADDAYNKHMTGQITAGFSTQGQSPFDDFLDEIEDIEMISGTMWCFPVPFKCKISRIRAYGNSTATAANTKINIFARGYSPSITSPSAVSTGETAGTSMSSINTGDVYWEFNNGLDVTVEANGWIRTDIQTDPATVSVASGDPYITHTSGIITLEEIL